LADNVHARGSPLEDEARYALLIGFGLLVLLLVRLAVAARMPLAFDEAYYWLWSEHLAAGYYDHPPMVAWVIRLGTLIAGDTEIGVRLVSVLLAVPATWAVWRAAAILFGDRRLAATAALFFNLTLMVGAGTVVVTPDAPLLVASAFLLFFLVKVAETGDGRWWLAAGLAAGCALLSKYNALFFGVGILAWLIVVPTMRRWLASPWPYLGGALALALFAPVILWNAEHQWVSFVKQFGRAVVREWSLRYLGEYVAAQIGLATPSIFVLGAMGVWAFMRGRGAAQAARVLLAALILPATIYFLWHSLHARVEGNWTAPVFPAFALAAAAAAHGVDWKGGLACLAEWSRRLAAPVALAMIGIIYAQAVFGVIPLGDIDPTARQLGTGWRAVGTEIDAFRRANGARAVLTTGYALTGWLSFYLPSGPPVVQLNERIRWINAPEPNPDLFRGPLLYVCEAGCGGADLVRDRFESVQEVARIPRRRRGVVIEVYTLYRVQGPRGDPLDGTPPRRP
jgi:4-amino-4-deoxy-L-arabinose transferase-like glycosyltransferase